MMPGFTALNDIARELRSQLVDALSATSDIDFPVTRENLLLSSPSSDVPDGTVGVLYLYHFDIDPHLRNRQLLSDGQDPALMHKPPLPLQCRFLFVPVDPEEENNQLMLGRILQHFHDHSCFRPMPGTALAKSRGEAPEELRVRFDFPSHQELAQLWSGFSTAYRLSLGLLVEVVSVDSGEADVRVPRVGSAMGGLERNSRTGRR